MKSYDENESFKHNICHHANKLYGWAMSEYFPFGEFKWLTLEKNWCAWLIWIRFVKIIQMVVY